MIFLILTSTPGTLLHIPWLSQIATFWSAPLVLAPQLTHPLSETVPRPVTVLAGSVADLLAAKAAREAAQATETPGGSGDGTDAQGLSGIGTLGFGDPFASPGGGGSGAAAAATSGGNGEGNGAAAAAGAPGSSSHALGARRALSKASSIAVSAVTGKSSGATSGGAALAAATAVRAATAAVLGAAADSDSESDGGADPALDILKPQPLSVRQCGVRVGQVPRAWHLIAVSSRGVPNGYHGGCTQSCPCISVLPCDAPCCICHAAYPIRSTGQSKRKPRRCRVAPSR